MKASNRELKTLAVELHGIRIGSILRLAGDKQIFTFEQSYIDDPRRPILSLSFKGQTGGLLTTPQQVHRRVPPFFSNLLPEGHLRTYLAEQAGVNPEREFFLLAALGADLAGAVTVRPLDGDYPGGRGQQPACGVRRRTTPRAATATAVFAGRRSTQVLGDPGDTGRADHSGRRCRWVVDR